MTFFSKNGFFKKKNGEVRCRDARHQRSGILLFALVVSAGCWAANELKHSHIVKLHHYGLHF
jgi:hypothetical protein